jgi:hypothetical protein
MMAKPFRGTINVDIRDSEPDWVPFEPPVAPYAAPNVIYMVHYVNNFLGSEEQKIAGSEDIPAGEKPILIDRVAIDVSGEPYHDLEREAALMLMRE